MVEWSRAFGNVPIHLHAADRDWVMRPDPAIKFWDGETLELMPDVTMIRGGGHFPGGSMLHWATGAGGRGVLCSSDIATVTTDRKFLTFMLQLSELHPAAGQRGRRASRRRLRRSGSTPSMDTISTASSRPAREDVLKRSVARYLAAIGHNGP